MQTAQGNIDEFRFIDAMVRNADPGGTRVVPAGMRLVVRGWMFAPNPARIPVSVNAIVSGRSFDLVQGRPPRPDIAESFGIPDLVASGYYGVLSLDGMPPGKYEVSVAGRLAGGARIELAQRSDFELVPSRKAFPPSTEAAADTIRITIDEFSSFRGRPRFEGGTLTIEAGDMITVRGWAIDTLLRKPVSGVFAVIDGRDYVMGVHGLASDDVASKIAMHAPEARRLGFVVRLKTRHLTPGIHTVAIRVVDGDERSYATVDAGRFILRGTAANGGPH